MTFGLGDKQKAFKFIDSLKLAKNLANLGDAKTLVIHPASTIFHEFSPADQQKMGIGQDMVRVSVGIEDFKDIQDDKYRQKKRPLYDGTQRAICGGQRYSLSRP